MNSTTLNPVRRNVARKSTSNRPLKCNLKSKEVFDCSKQVNIENNLCSYSDSIENLNQNITDNIYSSLSYSSLTNSCISKLANKNIYVKDTRKVLGNYNEINSQETTLNERPLEEEIETKEDDGIFTASSFMYSYLTESLSSPTISHDSSDDVIDPKHVLNYPQEREHFSNYSGIISFSEKSCDTVNNDSNQMLLDFNSEEQNDSNYKTEPICIVVGNRIVEFNTVTGINQNNQEKEIPVKMVVCNHKEPDSQNEVEDINDCFDDPVDESFLKVVSVTTLGDTSFDSLENDSSYLIVTDSDTKDEPDTETSVTSVGNNNKKVKKRKLRPPKVYYGGRKKKKKESKGVKQQNINSSVSEVSSENISPNETQSSEIEVEKIPCEATVKKKTKKSNELNSNKEINEHEFEVPHIEKETEKEVKPLNKQKNKPDIKQVAATKGIMLLSDSNKEVAVIQQGSTVINDKDALLKLNPSKIDDDTEVGANDLDVQQSLTEEILLEQALRLAQHRTSPRRKAVLSQFEERKLVQSILNSVPTRRSKRTTKNSLKASEEITTTKEESIAEESPKEQTPVNEIEKVTKTSPKKKKKKATSPKKKKKQNKNSMVTTDEENDVDLDKNAPSPEFADKKVEETNLDINESIPSPKSVFKKVDENDVDLNKSISSAESVDKKLVENEVNINESVENNKSSISDIIQCNIVESTDTTHLDASCDSKTLKEIGSPEKGPVSLMDLTTDERQPSSETEIPFISSSTKDVSSLEGILNEAQKLTTIVSGQVSTSTSPNRLNSAQSIPPTTIQPFGIPAYSFSSFPCNISPSTQIQMYSPQHNIYNSTPMASPYSCYKLDENYQNTPNFQNVYVPYMPSPSRSEDSITSQKVSSPAQSDNVTSPIPTKTMHDVPLSILVRDPRLKKRSALLPTPPSNSAINSNPQPQPNICNTPMGMGVKQNQSYNINMMAGRFYPNTAINTGVLQPLQSPKLVMGSLHAPPSPALLPTPNITPNPNINYINNSASLQQLVNKEKDDNPKPLMSILLKTHQTESSKASCVQDDTDEEVQEVESEETKEETPENPEKKKIKKKKSIDPELQYKTPLSDLHDIPERTSSYNSRILLKKPAGYETKKEFKIPRRKESTDTNESLPEETAISENPNFNLEDQPINSSSGHYPILGKLVEMIRTESSESMRQESRHPLSEYPPAYQRLKDFQNAELKRKKEQNRSNYNTGSREASFPTPDYDRSRLEDYRRVPDYPHDYRRNEDNKRPEEHHSYRRSEDYAYWKNREFSPEYRRGEEHRDPRWSDSYGANYRKSDEYCDPRREYETSYSDSEEPPYIRKRDKVHEDSSYSRYEYAHKRVDGRFPIETDLTSRDRYKRLDRELSWTEENDRDLIEGPEIPYSRRKRSYSSSRSSNWKSGGELYERRSGSSRSWKDDSEKYGSRKSRKDYDERKRSSKSRERESEREPSPPLESPMSPEPEFVPYQEPLYLSVPQ